MDIYYEKKLNELKEYLKKIEYIKYMNNILYWDKATNMPSKGIEYRSEVMGYLAGETHRLSEDKDFFELLSYFENKDIEELDNITISMIRKIKRDYEHINKIPKNEYEDYISLIIKAEKSWEIYKKEDDFESMIPYIEKIINYFKNFAEYWGYEENPYDAILSFYEVGTTVKKIDPMFNQLKRSVIKLLKDIEKSRVNIQSNIFKGNFDKKAQSDMTEDILNRIGFNFNAGRVDEGNYSTIISNHSRDVRIITHYDEKNLAPGLTTALHAGGQALYEQGISSELQGTLLAEPSSLVILEAIAIIYRDIIGKDEGFWNYYYPTFQSFFPQFENIKKDDFIRSLNQVEPSFIRVDSDEVTYNLHIIIRYEIEKDLINNKLEVKDIPEAWNKKYKDYLGIEPPNNSLGVLQDVHWFSGYFGYFPSYILGNFYAAQIYNYFKIENPDYESIISSGNWKVFNEWFNRKIFRNGGIYDPEELIYIVTDENLKADYFIEYLEKKYRNLYEI